MNNKNVNDRLYIATVCEQYEQISARYGIGIELDQFCMAEKLDGEAGKKTKREIDSVLKLHTSVSQASSSVPKSNSHTSADTLQAPKRTLHAPFNELFPAAIDPKAGQLAMERMQQAAELSLQYQVDKMIVHSGYVPFVYFKEWHIARSVEFWQQLMEGKPENFKITIENVLEDEPYMMAEMMEQIDNANIGLCLDVGHANCMSEIPVTEWLNVMAPRLSHLHIHNNDGSHDYHRALGDGSIDMEEFLERALVKVGDDTTITIESLDGTASANWLEQRGYLRR